MNRVLVLSMAIFSLVSFIFGLDVFLYAIVFGLFLVVLVESAIDYYFKKLKEHEK